MCNYFRNNATYNDILYLNVTGGGRKPPGTEAPRSEAHPQENGT